MKPNLPNNKKKMYFWLPGLWFGLCDLCWPFFNFPEILDAWQDQWCAKNIYVIIISSRKESEWDLAFQISVGHSLILDSMFIIFWSFCNWNKHHIPLNISPVICNNLIRNSLGPFWKYFRYLHSNLGGIFFASFKFC